MEVLWPPDLIPSSQTWTTLGNAASFESPLSGVTRTYGRPGVRMGCTITLPMMRGRDRARWLALLSALKDRSNRIWMPDFSMALQSGAPIGGSFPATELLTNNNFSNGATGWSVYSDYAITTADRVRRAASLGTSNNGAGAPGGTSYPAYQSPPRTQYAPHAMRSFLRFGGTQTARSARSYFEFDSLVTPISGDGMSVSSAVSRVTSDTVGVQETVSPAGGYVDIVWTSAARCALVDGGCNAALYSDQLDNAAWSKSGVSATANAATAPDGTSTAEAMVESNTNVQHYTVQSVSRASAVADVIFSGYFKRGSGTRDVRIISGDGGANYYDCYINLGTGAVTALNAFGTATNGRAFVVNAGNGWFHCALVCRAPASSAMYCEFDIVNGGTSVYLGDGTSSIYAWRVGCALSGVPMAMRQTVASALASGVAQTGSGIYVKGLPANTSGILEIGDFVQCGDQLNRVTARLDSDAAGLGYLQCANPFRSATNDAPIIVNTPMCKMMLAGDSLDLETGPGQHSALTLELVEAIE